jgi:hypothetical protein
MMQQEIIYSKQQIRSMRRGESLYPPIIVSFGLDRRMIFHDVPGSSIRIADDVTAEDAVSIWVKRQFKQRAFNGDAQYQIASSSGSTYTVTLQNARWSCTCAGFGFRKRCRHLEQAKQQHK